MNKNTKRQSFEKHKSARTGKRGGDISHGPDKNVKMVLYINRPEVGPASSITRFEVLDPSRPAFRRVFPKIGSAR
jgi:hypothetical protein